MQRLALTMAAALSAALPAAAEIEIEIRPDDERRMEQADATFGHALRQAFAQGATADVAVLSDVMVGAAGALSPGGMWDCRIPRLGGEPPLVVYGSSVAASRPRHRADGRS